MKVRAMCAALCVAGFAGVSAAGADRVDGRFVEIKGELEFSGQIIVRPRQGLAADRSNAARQRLAAITLRHYPEVDEYVVSAPAGRAPGAGENALISRLMATGDYEYAHPNWTCYPVVEPNDPRYAEQWHHPIMQAPAAWNLLTGSPLVTVAVCDTGVYLNHADLEAHRVPGFNAVDDVTEADGGNVSDVNGHGTHVAGCAAAIGDNSIGVCGVGWNLRIMMVRVSNSSGGGAYLDDILQGARWAVEHGAKSSSASYTGVNNAAVGTTGTYIKSIGGLFLYAADNSATDHSGFDFPDTLVIGASDQADGRAWFSSYGLAVDLFTPGVDILSSTNDGAWGFASGTSMATPVANGLIGMIWSVNPAFTPQQVESFLFGGCDDIGDPGEDNVFGHGRGNILRSLQLAIGSMGPAAPTASPDTAETLSGVAQAVDVLANDFDVNGDSFSITEFDTTSPHGAIVRSVGSGPGGRDQLLYTPAPAYIGMDGFAYTVTDSTGRSASTTVSMAMLDPALFRTPENPRFTRPGVHVDYYALSQLSALPDFDALTPYAGDEVPNVDFPSTGGDFITSGRADDVGAVFEGYISVPSTAQYTLYTNSDDGSKLYIGSTQVVDNDGLHGMREVSGVIRLQEGTHACRVTFFERGGGAGVIASIQGPGLSKRVIPTSMWSMDRCPADHDGDGFVTGTDFDAFVAAFERGDAGADFDGDGFVTGLDFDSFVAVFEEGC